MVLKYVTVFLFIWFAACQRIDNPEVTTPLGKVRGQFKKSFEGRTYSAFEGIPYAKPPVGDLRFAEPQAIHPWLGTWDATNIYVCSQINIIVSENPMGNEDCLYVNVYVPRKNPKPDDKLDVIVTIHGGGFMMGSGSDYPPDYLMDRDVVFVTINYRLGILGFLSTEDAVVSGNNGFKDQTLALKWVQQNIASFGGNPNSVTITGISAGGASVHFHYLSPLSKNLFHRGFSQSGVAINCWTLQENAWEKAQKLAVAVGCPNHESKALIECLKQRPVQTLLKKLSLFFGPLRLPTSPFAPVVEKNASKSFLPQHPYFMMTQKKIMDVPWITSNTADEGLMFTASLTKQLGEINGNWTEIAPFLLDYNYTVPKSNWTRIANNIKKFYAGEEINLEELTKMTGDRSFAVDAESAVRLHSKATKSPVYYYKFNYRGNASLADLFSPPGGPKITGVSHGDDGQYIYSKKLFNNNEPLTETDLLMRDAMLDMLTSFARTGIPEIKNVIWEPTKYNKLTYLNILDPTEMKLQTTDELTPRSFWTQLGILENENIVGANN